jgi:putative endonuclease
MRQFYVYILASHSKVLYIGVTNDLLRRIWEHRFTGQGFTKQYRVDKLVYFEQTLSPSAAIAREKQIKGWVRRKKRDLIESENPFWLDLADGWFDEPGK